MKKTNDNLVTIFRLHHAKFLKISSLQPHRKNFAHTGKKSALKCFVAILILQLSKF